MSPDRSGGDGLRRDGVELVAASFVVLFQELALIRWLPVEVRVTAYFPNLILIAAFLGLGVGALSGRRRSVLWLWPLSLVVVVAAAAWAGTVAFTAEGVTEHLWLLYDDLPEGAPVHEGIGLPIVAFFCLAAASFVPLGQFVGVRLERFRTGSSALWGYALDLAGSLLGVVGFTAVSASGLPPALWFLPVALVGVVVVLGDRRVLALHAVASGLVVAGVVLLGGGERYSPYYALTAVPEEGERAVAIRANGSLHQIALDLGAEGAEVVAEGYRVPYERLARPVRRALVLGAGTGNDVAALLGFEMAEIHAVEIDPVIIELGRELHPNEPYADPRVTVHNVDARSFLNETDERFDLIVFGTLDSMTRLSALSNVRLDNFVYTREALVAARERLTPDGGVVMYFMVGEPYISDHLVALLASTFGHIPQVELGAYHLFNTVFMAGPAYASAAAVDPDAWFLQEDLVRLTAPSDDWPYLYLPERGVTPFYWSMMAVIAALSVLAVLLASPELRAQVLRGSGFDAEMFLYGFAFLLIETKFVTAMNLLWGATWLTSAVVFGSILLVVLLATVGSELRPVPWRVAGAGLVAALAVVWLTPLELLLSTSVVARLALSLAYVGLPVLFAATCFAARFRVRPAADLAFGWNLLGAVLGGLTEFLSMAWGFRALTLVAIAVYLGAFLAARTAPGGTPAVLAPPPAP